MYKIQLEAPTPKAVLCSSDVSDAPAYYSQEYHGPLDHRRTEELLRDKCDGSYLVRRSASASDFYTLSLRFSGRTKHYKVYYKPNRGHFLKEDFKRFETINDLVADGLVNFYMQVHAAPIIHEMMTQTRNCYQQSPYMTLNRRKLRALSNDLRKSLKLDNQNGNNNESVLITSTTVPKLALTPSNQNVPEDIIDALPVVYEKAHKFKIHNFKGLNWCEFCANFLWGFTAQGVKCEDCGFIAHNKCSELVPAKCVPDLKKMRGVFATDLTTLVTAHQCTIPFVIKRCVEEVEARGMLQEGIYRVSGFADEIEALKLALDRDGEKTDMSETAYSNVNVVAGTLKLYLRLLPVPLVTFHAYPAFMTSTSECFSLHFNRYQLFNSIAFQFTISGCKSVGEQVIQMREAMRQLPLAHFNCLKFMIEHLNR